MFYFHSHCVRCARNIDARLLCACAWPHRASVCHSCAVVPLCLRFYKRACRRSCRTFRKRYTLHSRHGMAFISTNERTTANCFGQSGQFAWICSARTRRTSDMLQSSTIAYALRTDMFSYWTGFEGNVSMSQSMCSDICVRTSGIRVFCG